MTSLNPDTSTYLFDESKLLKLDLSSVEKFTSNPPGYPALAPSPGLVVRPLSTTDYDAGYLEVMSQLTNVGDVTRELFLDSFNKMKNCQNSYFVTVIQDTDSGKVVGSGTLFIEQKIIHGCALRGRLEDIVIDHAYRGKQLGKVIVLILTRLAKELNCYKVSLDCRDEKRSFYEGLGYKREENNSNFMMIRYR